MDIFIWTIMGYVIGWMAPDIFKNYSTKNMLLSLFLGIAGSLIGGFTSISMFNASSVSNINSLSAITSAIGAITLIIFGKKLDKI